MTEPVYLDELEKPPVLAEVLMRMGSPHGAERKRLEEHLALSYHFGGFEVAYRKTKRGPAIVAAGPIGSTGQLLNTLSGDEQHGIAITFPTRWEEIVRGVCAASRRGR